VVAKTPASGGAAAGPWSIGTNSSRTKKDRELVEEPQIPEHTRMMIVTDYDRNEYRLFFLTEESEESFFEFPDKG
jgi:hypothetical protein